MAEFECRGLTASWLDSWLAAAGATVLDDRIRLHWSDDAAPVAVLSAVGQQDPLDLLVESWPSKELITDMPIAADWQECSEMGRKVPVETFVERCQLARAHPLSWTLSSTVTDLVVYESGEVAHAPLDPKGPGTVGSLHHRLSRLLDSAEDPANGLRESLRGAGQRVVNNGLGFDLTRVASLADKTQNLVDPFLEAMAFFGLALFVVRGAGVDQRLGRRSLPARQRCWSRDHFMTWPSWSVPLDRHGLDALLDVWTMRDIAFAKELGVTGAFRSVDYQERGSADTTVGFGSEHLW